MARLGKIKREENLKEKSSKANHNRCLLNKKLIELESKKRLSSDDLAIEHYSKEIFAISSFLQRTRSKSYIRVRNRCQITGRTRGYLGRFKMSRVTVRHLASFGLLNGVKKSSHS